MQFGNRRRNISRSLAALAMAAGIFAGSMSAAQAAILQVNNGGTCSDATGSPSYCTIGAAVTAANANDTVQVAAGTYNITTAIVVDKPLTILGAQAYVDPRTAAALRTAGAGTETVISGSTAATYLFSVLASNVEINGFDLFAAGTTAASAAISSLGSSSQTGARLRYNFIHSTERTSSSIGRKGIALKGMNNALVDFNHVYMFYNSGIELSGNASQGACTNAQISDNEVRDTGNGGAGNSSIYMFSNTGSNAVVMNATISRNLIYNHFGNDALKLGSGVDRTLPGLGGTVEDNVIHDVDEDGITVEIGQAIVRRNTIYNCSSANGTIYVYSGNGTSVTNNTIFNCTSTRASILIGDTANAVANITVKNNSIVGNTANTIYYRHPAGVTTLDASGNWFGTTAAATVLASNRSTQGSSTVTVNRVDFTPWLGNGIDSEPATPGFQPNFASLYVGPPSLGLQLGATGRIDEAIGLAATSGVVTVSTGSYTENFTLGKNANVSLADASTVVNGTASVSDGILTGAGNITGGITATGGAVAPGIAVGTLSAGSVSLGATSTLSVQLDGGTSDLLNSAGGVTLTNAILSVSIVSAPTGPFTIVSNGSGSPVSGTFNGLAQGATLTTGGYSFAISYTGGDGNDITLTAVTPNELPTISAISDITIPQGTSTGDLTFTIGDAETLVGNLTVTKASTNTLLAPLANILIGGTGANRTVTVNPNTVQSGTSTITITVTDGEGATATSSFILTVVPRPIINNVNPYAAGVGTTVGISGTHFTVAGNVTAVTFNGISASFTQSGSLVSATVPAGNVNGPITVTTAGGTATSAQNFALVLTPTITTFSPTAGGFGTLVSFSGNNLLGATEVRLNGTICPGFTIFNDNLIRFNVPSGTLPGKITVLTPGGLATSANDFTVYPPPEVLSISPLSGNIGATVSIAGNFLSSVQTVRFGNAITSTFIAVNNNLIRVAVPAGAVSSKITVTTLGGVDISDDTFTVILKPSIAVFSPTSGGPGTLISFSGNNLGNVQVSFNGVPATTTQVSAFQVRAVVPVGATTGKVSATNLAGDTGYSTADFIVLQAPTITSLTPATGPVGTGVVIAGSNFSGVTSVKFNGIAAAYTLNNASQITTTVPANATTGKVTVTTNIGTGTSPADFTVTAGTAAPSIISFSPTTGANGATVVITGTGFTGATAVQFTGASSTLVASSYRVDSAQQITATVPSAAVTGTIRVVTAGGAGVSSGSFTVLKYPVIYSFSPTTGPAGLAVTLTGANFTGTSAVTFVSPTGTANAGFSLLSSTSIRCNVPNGAITGKISVTNAFGTGQTTTDFLVSPKVESFTPTSGPVGTLVTITGRAFTGATAVQFNGVLAEYTILSATQIRATVPAGASTGVITVNSPGGIGNSTTNYTVTP